jgi:hypothetical protein
VFSNSESDLTTMNMEAVGFSEALASFYQSDPGVIPVRQ